MDEEETTRSLVTQIVAQALPASMITNYIVIVECIDEDGQVNLYSDTSSRMPTWHALGMLEFAHQKVKHSLDQAFDGGDDE